MKRIIVFVSLLSLTLSSCDGIDLYKYVKSKHSVYTVTYFAVGTSGQIWKSDTLDAATVWQDVTDAAIALNGASYGNNALITVGGSFPPADNGFINLSSDGATWNDVTPASGAKVLKDVIYSGSRFIVIGDDGGTKQAWTSENGSSWTELTVPAGSNNTDFNLNGITYGNGIYVIAGGFSGAGDILWSNDDGNTWGVSSPATCDYLNEVTYGNGRFLVVGRNGDIWYADDPTANSNWNQATSGTGNDLNSVVYGGGYFMAVGASGQVVRSTDGINWTDVSYGTEILNSIIYADGKFIAAGANGTILWTTNGDTWNDISPGGNSLSDLVAIINF